MEKIKGVACDSDTLKLLITDRNGSRFVHIPIADIWEWYKHKPTPRTADRACTCDPDAIGHSYDCPDGGNPLYNQNPTTN